jgi:hypothetical protein
LVCLTCLFACGIAWTDAETVAATLVCTLSGDLKMSGLLPVVSDSTVVCSLLPSIICGTISSLPSRSVSFSVSSITYLNLTVCMVVCYLFLSLHLIHFTIYDKSNVAILFVCCQ